MNCTKSAFKPVGISQQLSTNRNFVSCDRLSGVVIRNLLDFACLKAMEISWLEFFNSPSAGLSLPFIHTLVGEDYFRYFQMFSSCRMVLIFAQLTIIFITLESVSGIQISRPFLSFYNKL